ncbi:hypothetical protein NA57DRAFT_67868 [Rhizodiscina lignyota]|uniref:Uncharacterized protein n=1 Tax=Rhizodiscina lignyota TaxID=1504668 RepID=A0A9P4M5N0_9PEZI|nr:hypothetical protein NA57DRAFT_67868 [Rhizodiscina lignyota]
MADGLNDARAVRIAEVINDFRNLQHYLSQMNVAAPAHEYHLTGYEILRVCIAEAQSVLAQPFATTNSAAGTPEAQRAQLQAILLDACIRRFRCQRAYLRACAVIRWIQGRNSVLQGQVETTAHATALHAVDQSLRAQEISAITDEYVETALRASDTAQGKWVAEDPSVATIQQHL